MRTRWAAATDDAGAAFGYRELAAAYGRLRDAWFAEFGAHIAVLEELAAGIEGSAGTEDAAGICGAAGADRDTAPHGRAEG